MDSDMQYYPSDAISAAPSVPGIFRRILRVIITFFFAIVGSAIGSVTGALIGSGTETGVVRGFCTGVISGAIFSIHAVEFSIEKWSSGDTGFNVIVFLMDIISSLVNGRIVWEKVNPAMQSFLQTQMSYQVSTFSDSPDLFDTSSTGGISADSLQKLQKKEFNATDSSRDSSCCCSVCLQEFEVGELMRVLPQCQHEFHVKCIDAWLVRHGSCPLCRRGVELEPFAI